MYEHQTVSRMDTGVSHKEAVDHCRLPLVVGVTGHRDYDRQYEEQLKEAVRSLLKRLREDYHHSELILLSPLAPGADRLAADVALEMDIPLYVPLPFPRNHLPPGFIEADEQRFETLCNSAARVFFIGFHPDAPAFSSPSQPSREGSPPDSEAQYASAGAFVATHCHILIALWDGETNSQTARTLTYKVSGLPQEFDPGRSLLDTADLGLWQHIYTPRKSTSGSASQFTRTPGSLVAPRSSESGDANIYHALNQSIDDYNKQVEHIRCRADTPAKLDASRDKLIQGEDAMELSPALKQIRDAFAAADVLAIEFKLEAHQHFTILASLVVAASLIFLVQAECPFFGAQEKPWLLLIAAGLLLIVQRLRRLWGRGGYQDKFQDYRALAEGLRVQFYWTLVGMPDSVADYYLRKQRSELDWIRRVFSIWNIYEGGGLDARPSMPSEQRPFRVNIVRDRWVEDQKMFFTTKHKQNAQESHWTKLSGKRLLNIYIGFMGISGLLLLFVPRTHMHILHGSFILLIELPLIAAAVLHLREEKFALSAQAKQYERMYQLFSRTSKNLAQFLKGEHFAGLSSDRQVDDLLRHLGREALEENADWVLMHRERLLEVASLS